MKVYHYLIILIISLFTLSCSSISNVSESPDLLVFDGLSVDLEEEQRLLVIQRERELRIDRREMIVFFPYNKAVVNEEFNNMLAAHAQYLKAHPAIYLQLEGHADETGDESYNYSLSLLRSNNVKKFLVNKGVKESQLIVKAKGENKSIDYSKNFKGRSLNRRVEFVY